MNEKVAKALGYVDEKYVTAAAKRKKKKATKYWISAVAAVLALVLLFNLPSMPMVISAKAVSIASESRQMQRPDLDDYKDRDQWRADREKWEAEQKFLSSTTRETVDALAPFFTNGSAQFLSTQGSENQLWSPINAYIGLALMTELTDGASRQQILDLFGARDIDALRQQVGAIWESAYNDNGHEISTLANSLWLENGLNYQQDTMDNIAYYYYASVYQGDLGSQKINNAIGAWINNNTGGFLKKSTSNVNLSPDTILALYSTIYFQAKWQDEFFASKNTQDTFHAPNGDKTVTFMNKKLAQMNYYYRDARNRIGFFSGLGGSNILNINKLIFVYSRSISRSTLLGCSFGGCGSLCFRAEAGQNIRRAAADLQTQNTIFTYGNGIGVLTVIGSQLKGNTGPFLTQMDLQLFGGSYLHLIPVGTLRCSRNANRKSKNTHQRQHEGDAFPNFRFHKNLLKVH